MKHFIKPRFLESLTSGSLCDDLPEDDGVKPAPTESFCANSDLFSKTHFASGTRGISEEEYARQARFYESCCF